MKDNFTQIVNDYFVQYLKKQRGMSQKTINSYIETFLSLFKYFQENKKIKESKLNFEVFNKENIIDFLDYLTEKGNKPQTRNQRLSAIHSFCRYVLYQDLNYYKNCSDVLAIPFIKSEKTIIEYLSIDDIKTILNAPNINSKKGLRDTTILSLLYSTGCRVSEFINIRLIDIDFNNNTVLVSGKGRKSRHIPINKETMKLINSYILNTHINDYLFVNSQNSKLTRAGINHIINKYVTECRKKEKIKSQIKIGPHTFRHSIATHLLNSGLPLIYIRDFLGHESVQTTEVYAKLNSSQLKDAIEKHSNEFDLNPNINVSYNDDKIFELLKQLKI